jgi:hypothetical protein
MNEDARVAVISKGMIDKILAELQALPHGKVAGLCKYLNELQHDEWHWCDKGLVSRVSHEKPKEFG